MNETKKYKPGPGRNPLPEGQKKKKLQKYLLPEHYEIVEKICDNLNRYGTIDPPK